MSKRNLLALVVAALVLAVLWFALRSPTAREAELAGGPPEPRADARASRETGSRESESGAADGARKALEAERTSDTPTPAPVAKSQAPSEARAFFARVVRDEDLAPIPFAKGVFVHEVAPRAPGDGAEGEEEERTRTEPVVADADAVIELHTLAELQGALLVDVDGFAQAAAPIVPGHETREKAFVLRLSRAATLHVRVVGAAGEARPALSVRAEARAYELSQSDFWFDDTEHARSSFTGTTDAEGRVTLAGLPPRVELELAVLDRAELLMTHPSQPRLEPGEAREIVLVVGGRATLAGRAIDQTGAAVAGEEIWLVEPDPSMGLVFREWTTPAKRARTDENGRFEFPDVREGVWWIGPSGGARGAVPAEETRRLAATGERIVIPPGAGRFEVELRLVRGLYLSGVVRETNGAPVAGCTISADATDPARYGYLGGKSDESGAFRIGPVLELEYRVTAGGAFQGDFAQSPPVLARGGSADLVLVVTRAAKLRGVVLDPESGEPCDAQIFLSQAEVHDGFAMGLGTQTNERAFEVTGITPGLWDVVVTGRNGTIATTRVTLGAGETKEVSLRLAPSVALVFKNTSADDFYYVFPQCDGLAMQSTGVSAGTEARLDVAPGRITVRIADAQAKTLGTRTIDIAPGASGEISFP